ncbi:sodium/potassium-transporting ATPase subunit beta-1-interacting protein 3-like [Corticium candelabrum]|uniref:sodium/potassium-transporting ATPase subunit beta-1-interacting protein 3-like n=1 Tax=Corticium candelabrum TaxID=121492 RepID=UPI002E25E035|nr:sodium/potassium-transporting ATPase subunit beta-1-interacting protein 3-like [Corticium candelabrum]
MACCTSRCVLVVIFVFQLVATVERLVFDFLGQMWTPVIINFVNMAFVIIAMVAVSRFRAKLIVLYLFWCVVWIALNTVVILIYLEVDFFITNDQNKADNDYLNINTGHTTWFTEHGFGCKVNETTTISVIGNATTVSTVDKDVTGCFLDYKFVEIIQAGVQILFAIFGFGLGVYVAITISDDDDHFDYLGPEGIDSFSNVSYEAGHKSGHMQLQAIPS